MRRSAKADPELTALADELVALEDSATPAAPSTFLADSVLHARQAALVMCAALTVIVCAGRRWGKSVAACFRAYMIAMATPGVTCCLIGATQGSISRIFWKTLKAMSREHSLGATFLKGIEGWAATLPNGSQIVLLPVDSEEAADKVRGLSNVAFVCVDESQRYKAEILTYLLKDVIAPMFIDLRAKGSTAQLWLMGTPNHLGKRGTFWDYMNRKGAAVFAPGFGEMGSEPGAFTVYENSKLGTRERIEQVIDQMLDEEEETRAGAWYKREILAQWVIDTARMVYYFDDEANTYDELPGGLTSFALIFDIGVRNADAVGLWGWRDGDPTLYLVKEIVKVGADTLDLEAELRALLGEYNTATTQVIVCAGDGGGLGLKIIMTVQKLLKGVPVKAVAKPTVNLQVKAFNTRARRGLKCSKASRLYAEVRNSEWEDGIVNGKIIETGHSDVVPMARYAAVELENLLPDAPTAETDEERKRREYLEGVRRAEENRKRAEQRDTTYDDGEFSDDLEADVVN